MRLHGGVGDFVREEASFGDVVGLGKGLVGIAEDMVVILLQVVALIVVNEVFLSLHRVFGIEVGGQEFVIDVDQFEGLFGDRFGDGGDAGYVVAHVADLVKGERVLVVTDGENAEGIRGVFAGDDRDDAVELAGAGRVDALDSGMRMRRVQDLAIEHAGN